MRGRPGGKQQDNKGLRLDERIIYSPFARMRLRQQAATPMRRGNEGAQAEYSREEDLRKRLFELSRAMKTTIILKEQHKDRKPKGRKSGQNGRVRKVEKKNVRTKSSYYFSTNIKKKHTGERRTGWSKLNKTDGGGGVTSKPVD